MSSVPIHTSLCPSALQVDALLAGIPQIYHFGQEGLHNILVCLFSTSRFDYELTRAE